MQNLSEKRIGIVIVGGTIRDIYAFFLAQCAVYIVKSYIILRYFYIILPLSLLSVLQHLSRHDLVQSANKSSVDYEIQDKYSVVKHSPEPWGKCQLDAAVYI